MNLTEKERTLLEDIKTNEQLCIDKYTKYSEQASKKQLKDIFNEIKQAEISHLNTVTEILNGVDPNVGGSSGFNACDVEKILTALFPKGDSLTPASSSSSFKNMQFPLIC